MYHIVNRGFHPYETGAYFPFYFLTQQLPTRKYPMDPRWQHECMYNQRGLWELGRHKSAIVLQGKTRSVQWRRFCVVGTQRSIFGTSGYRPPSGIFQVSSGRTDRVLLISVIIIARPRKLEYCWWNFVTSLSCRLAEIFAAVLSRPTILVFLISS